jgi:hypothetical protein
MSGPDLTRMAAAVLCVCMCVFMGWGGGGGGEGGLRVHACVLLGRQIREAVHLQAAA